MRAAWWITLLLAGGGITAGERAYRDGKFEEAWQAYQEAAQNLGDSASAELLFNQALAGWRAGHWPEAEAAAERAVTVGGPAFEPRRVFLQGCIQLSRADRVAIRAGQPGADPNLYTAAITLAVESRARWIEALDQAADWPEARRNIERTQLRIQEWEELREEALRKQKPPPPPPDPDEDEPTDPEEQPELADELPAQKEPGRLTAEEVQRLLDQLVQTEQEKRMRRRASRHSAPSTVEKDW